MTKRTLTIEVEYDSQDQHLVDASARLYIAALKCDNALAKWKERNVTFALVDSEVHNAS